MNPMIHSMGMNPGSVQGYPMGNMGMMNPNGLHSGHSSISSLPGFGGMPPNFGMAGSMGGGRSNGSLLTSNPTELMGGGGGGLGGVQSLGGGGGLGDGSNRTSLWMGELDPWMDENWIQQTWYNVLGEPVSVKLIRDKYSG